MNTLLTQLRAPEVSSSTVDPRDERPGSDPAGARTQDPLLKREMLYQLSYGINGLLNRCEVNREYRK